MLSSRSEDLEYFTKREKRSFLESLLNDHFLDVVPRQKKEEESTLAVVQLITLQWSDFCPFWPHYLRRTGFLILTCDSKRPASPDLSDA